MKTVITLAVLANLVAAGFATSLALASPQHGAAPRTLKIVMHDPGCHWFQIGTKFTKTAKVSGPIRLLNLDEATLKVASSHGLKRIPVGKSIVVNVGTYGITMVGQAKDDNHLKLTVR